MKAVNDYRILMPDVPYYETGLQFNEFAVVYYTGITPGNYSYTGPNGVPNISDNVTAPFQTGYYYLTQTLNSGDNFFFKRPDSSVTGPTSNPWTQNFFFVPCYGSSVSFKSNYYENVFQDNYKIILGKSENVVQASVKLDFKNITDAEFKALNHFYQRFQTESSLSNGQGQKTLDISLFPPHSKSRPYYLKSIQNDYQNIDANNVSLTLESPFICSTDWKEKLIPFTPSQEYSSTKSYGKHDYIFLRNSSSANGFYYFTGDSVNTLAPTNSSSFWTQKFYFRPDLVTDLRFESNAYKNDLGNFYLNQNVGINPNSFDFSLSFNNRSDKEARAILHFLENHNGVDLFEYDLHTFFTGSRNFFCPEWSHTYNFLDNNSISARLIEVKVTNDKTANFDSTLLPTGLDFGFLPHGFEIFKSAYVKNNDRKYPTTYTIYDKVEESTYASSFFSEVSEENSIQVKAGGSGYFDLRYKIPQNVSTSEPTIPQGYFPVSQENEIVGSEGGLLKIYYTGLRVNPGGAAPYEFLSGVKNCIASPVYQDNGLGLLVRWTVPESGFFYTGFSGRISTNSGFSPSTGVNVPINLNSTSFLYEIGTPGETTFQTVFTNLSVNTPYYVSISGMNNSYTNHRGVFVYASGVQDAANWPNPANDYPAVQSGLTTGLLASLGAPPPSISISKTVRTKNISNTHFEYLNLYDYIRDELSFSNTSTSYSGIVFNFNNVKIGPRTSDSVYDIYDTGSLVVTGDFSNLATGITLNLVNSYIYGKGGSTSENSLERNGKTAVYINCSGKLFFNLDSNSRIAGGGGAGDNILFTDISSYGNGKFGNLKEDFRNSDLAGSGVKDVVNNIIYDARDTQKIYSAYNNQSLKINDQFSTSVGSSIFYDFFASENGVDQDIILGSPGASLGKGSGSALYGISTNASIEQAGQPYNLVNLLIPGKDFYKE